MRILLIIALVVCIFHGVCLIRDIFKPAAKAEVAAKSICMVCGFDSDECACEPPSQEVGVHVHEFDDESTCEIVDCEFFDCGNCIVIPEDCTYVFDGPDSHLRFPCGCKFHFDDGSDPERPGARWCIDDHWYIRGYFTKTCELADRNGVDNFKHLEHLIVKANE